MKKRFISALVLSLFTSALSSATEPLKIGVTASFLPVLETIKPRLEQQLGVHIHVTAEKNSQLYDDHLKQLTTPYDLIIFAENESQTTPLFNKELIKVSNIITSAQVVLWCPYLVMPKRVSLSDSIKQVGVNSIAIPDPGSLVTQIFSKNVPKIPKSTYFVNASNSLTSWRMAYSQHVECAVTLDKWLKPTDQFNYVSTEPINFRGWIKENSSFNSQSRQAISILSSPLLQPLMMRSTSSGSAQNMK
jgi:hypothetical protein